MSDEHAVLQDNCRRFFSAALQPNVRRWREQGCVDRNFWREAGLAGLLGCAIPAQYGGADGDLTHDAVIILELGRMADPSWGFGVQSIVGQYLTVHGTEVQKQRWLPGLASGEFVAAIAMTEPGTGSDLQAVRTAAVRDGDSYVIDGSKTFITNGQTADLILVVVRTGEQGSHGLSLVVVETRDCAGFRRGRNLAKLGMGGQDTSELFFADARVPRSNLLGEVEGQGFQQLMRRLPWERTMIGIGAVGVCDAALRETLTYVRSRKVFGRRLMDLQNTRFKLAECKTRLEVLRAYIDRCIPKLATDTLTVAEASMAKLWGSETQCLIVDECLQLFGGNGYMLDYPIAAMYADARAQRIYGGANEIQKELIARALDA